MFNMGFLEMLAIGVIALVVIGPKQLPHVAKVIGRMMGEFRRATSDFHREIYRAEESFQTEMNQVKETVQFKVDEPNTKSTPTETLQNDFSKAEEFPVEDTSHSRHHPADLYPEDSYVHMEYPDQINHEDEHHIHANGDEADFPYELALKEQKKREAEAKKSTAEAEKEEDKA
ncbi:MAG: Sec-independent protein translocase protein TatB [Bdellovibrionota bacterium]|nr:Sec-independent protein translocase protein TatB [Bdellovibrionota bacterium]